MTAHGVDESVGGSSFVYDNRGRTTSTIKTVTVNSVSKTATTSFQYDTSDTDQEEFEADQPNLILLNELAAGTGGAVDAPVRNLVGRKPGTRRSDHPLDWLFVPAAMLLFLADVGLRRLSQHAQGE